jgi:hypothetical protein
VRHAISALEGSLTKLSHSEAQARWTFRHPTIGDAFAEVVTENPELLDIYLQGAKIDKLVQEVVCGNVRLSGVKVIVPEQRFAQLANRLNRELKIDAICDFLASRCSLPFLRFYFENCPSVFEYICSPHSYLHATLQTGLIPKLQKHRLLPRAQRHKLIAAVMELVVTTPDADFLTVERVGNVFTRGEKREFLAAIRTKVIPKLKDIIWDWKFNYISERDDPEEHFDLLQGALRAYEKEFKHDPEAMIFIEAGLERIQELIAELKPTTESPKPTLWEPDDSAISAPASSRDIFEDIDL